MKWMGRVGELKAILWNQVGGIIQADAEGFTNEDGYQILWQFSDSVTGTWWMGVFQHGSWIHFEMDLGNRQHREAFLRGEMPAGARQAWSGPSPASSVLQSDANHGLRGAVRCRGISATTAGPRPAPSPDPCLAHVAGGH
jgi:hypothetical protein